MPANDQAPLVSVIIPTFNYGMYIGRAIRSVLSQTYRHLEIIVIDDGSTDDSREIIAGFFPETFLTYCYQANRGLSAARNAGIDRARGEYLLFLDADDWLEPTGIADNVTALGECPETAFVAGNYCLFRQTTGHTIPVEAKRRGNAYLSLLKENYIGMLATVLFRRFLFADYRFDESLGACEDYDLYLRIARNHPVAHHNKLIATYFFHPGSLSHNHQLMMRSLQVVMQRQEPCLRSVAEHLAYGEGKDKWKEYACACDQQEAEK